MNKVCLFYANLVNKIEVTRLCLNALHSLMKDMFFYRYVVLTASNVLSSV